MNAKHMPPPEFFGDDAPAESGVAAIDRQLATLAPELDFDQIFVREPDAKLIIPALGIAPGPIHLAQGYGYVGKSMTCAFSLGLSVSSGTRAWGVYGVKRGRWLHLDHEQGRRHTKRYVTRLIDGMGISREALRGQMSLRVLPSLNLTTHGAEDLYARMFDGFDFVTVDALRGIIPGVDENSSEVRNYLSILSRASGRSQAAVIVIHHAGKTPTTGNRPRKEAGRGSSAIFDEAQSSFVLSAAKGEPILVSHEKTRELPQCLDDFYLSIEDVVTGSSDGGVRVVWKDGVQVRSETAASDDRRARARGSILRAVAKNTDLRNPSDVAREAKGERAYTLSLVQEMIRTGELVLVAGAYRANVVTS